MKTRNEQLAQDLRIARGRVLDELTRELLTVAAEAVEGPSDQAAALAFELPPLVADQLIHVIAQMPYTGGFPSLAQDPVTVVQLVQWLEKLVHRLEEHADDVTRDRTELDELRAQRRAVRAFVGLDLLRLHSDIAPEEEL